MLIGTYSGWILWEGERHTGTSNVDSLSGYTVVEADSRAQTWPDCGILPGTSLMRLVWRDR